MMIDVHGKQHRTVGDIPIDPRETEYCVQFKKWLKSITLADFRMMDVEKIVQKSTPKHQMILPMFPKWGRPIPPVYVHGKIV